MIKKLIIVMKNVKKNQFKIMKLYKKIILELKKINL